MPAFASMTPRGHGLPVQIASNAAAFFHPIIFLDLLLRAVRTADFPLSSQADAFGMLLAIESLEGRFRSPGQF